MQLILIIIIWIYKFIKDLIVNTPNTGIFPPKLFIVGSLLPNSILTKVRLAKFNTHLLGFIAFVIQDVVIRYDYYLDHKIVVV